MFFPKQLKIGLRTLKTGMAVLLTLLLLRENAFFACIAAIVSVQDTVEHSFEVGIARVYGTIIGALVGLGMIIPYHILDQLSISLVVRQNLEYLLIAIGVMIVIQIGNMLKKPDIISLSCMVFVGITLTQADSAPLAYAIERTVYTIIGIIVAVAINRFIKAPKKVDESE